MLPLAISRTLTGSHGKTRRWTSSIVAFTGTDTASRDIPKRSPWISRHSAKSSSLLFESLAFMVGLGSLKPMMSLRRRLGVVMGRENLHKVQSQCMALMLADSEPIAKATMAAFIEVPKLVIEHSALLPGPLKLGRKAE